MGSVSGLLGGGKKPKAPPPQEVKISEAERANAYVAARKWNDFLKRYAPVQDRFIKLATDEGDFRHRALGEAVSTANDEAAVTTAVHQRNLQSGGPSGSINPTHAVPQANMYRRGIAAAAGDAVPRAAERTLRSRLKVAAVGRGLADNASLASSGIAREQTRENLNNEQLALERRAGLGEALFTGLGAYTATKLR